MDGVIEKNTTTFFHVAFQACADFSDEQVVIKAYIRCCNTRKWNSESVRAGQSNDLQL